MFYVYLINSEEFPSLVKIGYSVEISKRLKSIQTGNSFKLKVRKYWEFETKYKARKFEKSMHRFFCTHRTSAKNEWFHLDPIHVHKIAHLIEQKINDASEEVWEPFTNNTFVNEKNIKSNILDDDEFEFFRSSCHDFRFVGNSNKDMLIFSTRRNVFFGKSSTFHKENFVGYQNCRHWIISDHYFH